MAKRFFCSVCSRVRKYAEETVGLHIGAGDLMTFYADLHIHSRFSRATSKDCNLEQLAYWAQRKGLAVVGTGDFTHPAWFDEIKEKLVPAEAGLFRLRHDLESEVERRLEPSCRNPTRFLLEVEISTIYKKGDRTRKVHHVVCVPDLEKAGYIIQRLSRIGNLKSDGRPILGLNSRNLLEITLESGEGSYLIPAHIWTPWFSMLGSKSGFDTIDECYEDLSSHIFAVETGLSSDPPMNWRLSSLDRYRLVSNSDAHSPQKLGREACVFDTGMDYFAMRKALETGEGYGGTVEFFPEEGKYHLDGHRKCGMRLSPEETRRNNGLCPVCGKAVTVGVMHRVDELADQPEGRRPAGASYFRSFVPLLEVLSQILGVGPDTNGVRKAYQYLISRLGTEMFILEHASIEDIRRVCSSVFAEAIDRMREGRVIREAGFDGEYGTIRLFEESELASQKTTGFLFEIPQTRGQRSEVRDQEVEGDRTSNVQHPTSNIQVKERRTTYPEQEVFGILDSLDPDQREAAEITEGSLLITAGPGTGKTRTLTHRVAHLIATSATSRSASGAPRHSLARASGVSGAARSPSGRLRRGRDAANCGVLPEQCLAITFTRRAAGEMVERLQRILPGKADRIPVMTFHALGYSILREHGNRLGLSSSFRIAGDTERANLLMEILSVSEREAKRLLSEISEQKVGRPGRPGRRHPDRSRTAGDGSYLDVYEREMWKRSLLDFDDLIGFSVTLLENHPDLVAHYRERYPWVSIDEYQDIDEQQYRLIRLLVPPDGHICAIGDPDQAIYGFRGTDVRFFQQFTDDFPNARTVQLTRNYRSGRMIVEASMQVIGPSTLVQKRVLNALVEGTTRIVIHECATDRAEAEFVVHTVERLIGGSTFFSMDSGRVESDEGESLSFSDFAVLYRTDVQAGLLCEAFARSGMPFQKRSHSRLADSPLMQSMINVMRDAQEKDRADGAALLQRTSKEKNVVAPPHGAGLLGNTPERCVLADWLDQAVARLGAKESQNEMLLVARALRPLAERCGDLEGFLSELALGVDVDLWDPRADCVSLLTLHASKGLEFPVVFIVGCEDGILPLRWGTSGDTDIDEERRLFFVGMTRARDKLFLCHAQKRRRHGKHQQMETSPFLFDIEEELLERSKTQLRKKKTSRVHEQLDLL